MDETAIDKKGLQPLQPELDAHPRHRKLCATSPPKSPACIASAWTCCSTSPPARTSRTPTAVIGQADQGGIGLPEKDYYFRTDAKAVETRKEYVAHVARMLQLTGVLRRPMPAKQADAIMRLETALAKVSLDVTTRRDPGQVYHKMKLAEFEALADSFDWTLYFAALQTPNMDSLNVAVPDFFKGEEQLLKIEPRSRLEDLPHLPSRRTARPPCCRRNSRTRTSRSTANISPARRNRKPRWKRCVACHRRRSRRSARQGLRRPDLRQGRQGPHARHGESHRSRHGAGPQPAHLDDARHEAEGAVEKLHAVTNKIGYPDKWRDYSALNIVRGDALGNSLRANEFEVNRRAPENRQAGRPPRVGHDPAHGQRLLRPADEQHQFPGRHPAAAVLRQDRRTTPSTTAPSAP